MKWKYELRSGLNLRNAIKDDDNESTLIALKECYKEINKVMPKEYGEDEFDGVLAEIDNQIDNCNNYTDYDMTEDDIQREINYMLSEFYDLCDYLRIWVGL